MKQINRRFAESLLDKNSFCVTWELVPGRGAHEKSQQDAVKAAAQAAADGSIHAVTITDNPGGRPALSATCLGIEIQKLGIEALIHFTCKDKNRNQIESELYALERSGVENLLVMSGDYPTSGFKGRARPVFDLDPVQLLDLINSLNNSDSASPAEPSPCQPTHFFPGCVVSPFKASEAELMAQYYKLKKKIDHGARFVITQLGFDARKFHEALQFVRLYRPELPVLGNIYVLPFGAAKMMNSNQLPGSVVTDTLLEQIDRERNDEDKGSGARLLRAAKMYAFMKGMGFDGVHLGGHNLKYEQVKYIIDKGEELSSDWMKLIPEFDYPQHNGFYYFEPDANGLNTKNPVNRSGLAPEYPVSTNYRLMRWLHKVFFQPGGNLFPIIKKYYQGNKNPQKYRLEHFLKVIGNGCQDCGDCALLDMAYLCPLAQCPKNQRNGACGGSFNGWCEVYPRQKKCIWVKAYAMLKAYHEESRLENLYVPPVNWDLYHTSAWYNYFTGRDHSAVSEKKD